MSTSAVLVCNSAIYAALDKLGAVPPQCRAITINMDCNRPITVTFECFLSEECDRAVAALLNEQEG